MKGVVYHGREDFKVEQVPDPGLQVETDALIRVTRTAICGSDLHFWHGDPLPVSGFTMGHEFLGLVEEVGRGVRRFRKGDRVLAACTIGCGDCGMCSRGLYGGCFETTRLAGLLTNVFGNPVLPGGQAEAVRVPFADTNLFRVPAALSDEQALFLTDILPTGYMGAEMAEIRPGDVVVVFGCGPVGIFAQRCAALFGAAAIVAVDLDDQRLERARAGGCIAVNPERENLLETVRGLTEERGADAVIEAVGRSELVHSAIEVARPGARISVIGVITAEPLELPYVQGLFAKSLTLRSAIVTPQLYIPRLLPLVEQGRLAPTEIITHRLPLDDAIGGYRTFASHADDVLKVVLQP
jgi:2-desacetyl-2-hydroxyethyl bacteriochlorophyllide A dehydrogenase